MSKKATGVSAEGAAYTAVPSRTEALGWSTHRVLILLTLVATLNFVDRNIINIVAEELKLELKLSDTQIGLVTGMAFALFYSVLTIPAARIADRVHRPRFLAAALAFWSACTMLCGMAGSFFHLVLGRMGVGIGESAGAPTTYSLAADSVPLSRRAYAMGFVLMGSPLGAMVGMGVGGIMVDQVGWRSALLLAGLPGLIVAACLVLVHEPHRVKDEATKPAQPSFLRFVREIWTKKSLRWMLAAEGLTSIVSMGKFAFVASFFLRVWKEDLAGWVGFFNQSFGLSIGAVAIVGVVYGVGTVITGIAGIFLGSRLADALGRKNMSVMLVLPACAKLTIVPLGLYAMFAPSLELAFFFMMLTNVANGIGAPAFQAAQMGLVSQGNRATITAVFLCVSTFVGLGLGPLMVGALSDFFNLILGQGSAGGLRSGFIAAYLVLLPTAFAMLMAARHFRKEFVS